MKNTPPPLIIQSGKFKGKRLFLPSLETTRSTKSRVRACVFNTIRAELKDKIFVEVFGGSGAMAFEALSNDALGVVIIEKDKKAYEIACENARRLLDSENSRIYDKAGLNFRGNSRNSTLNAVNSSGGLKTCKNQEALQKGREAVNSSRDFKVCENVGLNFNGNSGKFDCEALNSKANFGNFACKTLHSKATSSSCKMQALIFNENSKACDVSSINFGENSRNFDCEALNSNENSRNLDLFDTKNVRVFNTKSFIRERVLIFNADSFELLPLLFKDEKFSQNVIAYFDPPFHLRNGFEDIYERVFTLINTLQGSNLQSFIIEHSSQIPTSATFRAFTQHKFKKFGNTSLSFYKRV